MKTSDITLCFTGTINEQNVRDFISELRNRIKENPQGSALTIYISSPGGSVDLAFALFSFLKLLGCRVTTVNSSHVFSAANILFAAGDRRRCFSSANFYFHAVTKNLNGNFTAQYLLREAKGLALDSDKIASVLSDISNKNKSYWKRLMRKGSWLSPLKAREVGLVNEISNLEQKIF